jgi:hypothetical protein
MSYVHVCSSLDLYWTVIRSWRPQAWFTSDRNTFMYLDLHWTAIPSCMAVLIYSRLPYLHVCPSWSWFKIDCHTTRTFMYASLDLHWTAIPSCMPDLIYIRLPYLHVWPSWFKIDCHTFMYASLDLHWTAITSRMLVLIYIRLTCLHVHPRVILNHAENFLSSSSQLTGQKMPATYGTGGSILLLQQSSNLFHPEPAELNPQATHVSLWSILTISSYTSVVLPNGLFHSAIRINYCRPHVNLILIPRAYCRSRLSHLPRRHRSVKAHINTKLHGPSPRANYTDRATAACRRS